MNEQTETQPRWHASVEPPDLDHAANRVAELADEERRLAEREGSASQRLPRPRDLD